MKSLVVYFSITGNNRKIAELISRELKADMEEIKLIKPVKINESSVPLMGVKSFLGINPKIKGMKHDPKKYYLLVIGAPAMMGRMSPAIRTYLKKHRNKFPEKIALYMSCGGWREDKVMNSMIKEAKKKPVATLILKEKEDMESGAYVKKVEEYCRKLMG